MGFSKEWEEAYKNRTNISIWPWTDLISMFYHFFSKEKYDYSKLNVLELGCGAGANIPFFEFLDAKYDTVEGSITEVDILNKKFHNPKIVIKQGDFSKEIPFDNKYDLIFDRASVCHNETKDIIRIIDNCYDMLNAGGYYFGINWFSTKEKEYTQKIDVIKQIDDRTFRFGGEGTYAGLGNVHFTDDDEIQNLFSRYTPQELSLKSVETVMPVEDTSYHWNFAMRKD